MLNPSSEHPLGGPDFVWRAAYIGSARGLACTAAGRPRRFASFSFFPFAALPSAVALYPLSLSLSLPLFLSPPSLSPSPVRLGVESSAVSAVTDRWLVSQPLLSGRRLCPSSPPGRRDMTVFVPIRVKCFAQRPLRDVQSSRRVGLISAAPSALCSRVHSAAR